MPFAWTAIHLIDIISGKTANADVGSALDKDNPLATTPTRKVIIYNFADAECGVLIDYLNIELFCCFKAYLVQKYK